jgi:putative tryptophan/tyrosine transport system substrate-binding protein
MLYWLLFDSGYGSMVMLKGKKLTIEPRYAELDQQRLADLANELTQLRVDVILTSPDEPVIRAVQSVTRTIPVVMAGSVVDPVAATFWGEKQRAPLVVSLAKPHGNFTGLTNLDSDLHAKRLELLKEGVPTVARVALLWPRAQQQKQTLKDIEQFAECVGEGGQGR